MRTILILAAALALAIPAGADHCTTYSTHPAEFDTGAGLGVDEVRYYVNNDPCPFSSPEDGCGFSIWIYRESNGIDGQQRADEVVDDTCHGMIAGDTIVL